MKKKYVETRNKNISNEVIKEVVDITNNLYNKQKQHAQLQHDQTYYGLRDLKKSFIEYDNIYEPIFVRSTVKKGFEEYEIYGN